MNLAPDDSKPLMGGKEQGQFGRAINEIYEAAHRLHLAQESLREEKARFEPSLVTLRGEAPQTANAVNVGTPATTPERHHGSDKHHPSILDKLRDIRVYLNVTAENLESSTMELRGDLNELSDLVK